MTFPSRPPAKRFPGPDTFGLTLLLTLLQTGCAANTPTAAISQKTGPYYQDAQLCRARNPAKTLPPGADPATHVDASGYLKCMTQFGYQQDAKTDPLLVAFKKCRQQGTVSVSASGATAVKPPQPAAVRECLKQRGFPSAGQPPIPAAASQPELKTAPASSGPSAAPGQTQPALVKDPKNRVQTIYIPRKTPPKP